MDQTSTNLKIKFTGSFTTISKMDKTDKPEYAFIGRSNVGKSSLINMLSGNNQIAKVSKTPGKTQLINVFSIEDTWLMVDLPGYGYAKVAKTTRSTWTTFVADYIKKRENLACLFILLDSRLPLQKIDAEFMKFCGEHQIPIALIYTKTDKLTFNQMKKNISILQKEIKQIWTHLPLEFISSSVNKNGREEIINFISETNEQFYSKGV